MRVVLQLDKVCGDMVTFHIAEQEGITRGCFHHGGEALQVASASMPEVGGRSRIFYLRGDMSCYDDTPLHCSRRMFLLILGELVRMQSCSNITPGECCRDLHKLGEA